MKILSLILLTSALLLETTLTTLPLVLITIVIFTVIYRQNFIFILGFVFGILLDLILFKTAGGSSLFFTVFVFLILIYQRKFEINTASFVLISLFFGSFFYLLLFSNHNLIVLQAMVSSLIGLLIFNIIKRLAVSKPKLYE